MGESWFCLGLLLTVYHICSQPVACEEDSLERQAFFCAGHRQTSDERDWFQERMMNMTMEPLLMEHDPNGLTGEFLRDVGINITIVTGAREFCKNSATANPTGCFSRLRACEKEYFNNLQVIQDSLRDIIYGKPTYSFRFSWSKTSFLWKFLEFVHIVSVDMDEPPSTATFGVNHTDTSGV